MTDPATIARGLEPCPFCNCIAIWIEPAERGSGGQWVPPVYIGCSDCGASIRDGEIETSEAAIAAWNTRPTPPAEDAVEVVANAIAPIRHVQINNFGLKRPKTMAIDTILAQAAISALTPMLAKARNDALEEAALLLERRYGEYIADECEKQAEAIWEMVENIRSLKSPSRQEQPPCK